MATSIVHLDDRRTPASPALGALIRKRAEVAREADALDTKLGQLRADLVHLDAAIRIMSPNEPLPRISGRRGLDWFGRGELGRMVLDTLREAPAPMRVAEVAQAIIVAKELPADAAALRRVDNMVKAALRRQEGIVVERVVYGVREVGWKVIRDSANYLALDE